MEDTIAKSAWHHACNQDCLAPRRTFDLSQPIDLGLNSKDSLMVADDGAAVFTTPLSYHGSVTDSMDDNYHCNKSAIAFPAKHKYSVRLMSAGNLSNQHGDMAPIRPTRVFMPFFKSIKRQGPLEADEQFDVDEEELERTLSLGTAEKLRDAGIPAMQSLLDMQDNYLSPRMRHHPCLPIGLSALSFDMKKGLLCAAGFCRKSFMTLSFVLVTFVCIDSFAMKSALQ